MKNRRGEGKAGAGGMVEGWRMGTHWAGDKLVTN